MIFDWDLWPWRVAEGHSEYAILRYRLEREMRRTAIAIGMVLAPVMYRACRDLRRMLRHG